jgi:hypothetical protein
METHRLKKTMKTRDENRLSYLNSSFGESNLHRQFFPEKERNKKT